MSTQKTDITQVIIIMAILFTPILTAVGMYSFQYGSTSDFFLSVIIVSVLLFILGIIINYVISESSSRHTKTLSRKSRTNNIEPKSNSVTSIKMFNTMSIIGFCLSLASPFIAKGVLGVIGFALGIMSLSEIKSTRERGKGLAITAIVLGSLWGIIRLILNIIYYSVY